jgi:hypothetical protein
MEEEKPEPCIKKNTPHNSGEDSTTPKPIEVSSKRHGTLNRSPRGFKTLARKRIDQKKPGRSKQDDSSDDSDMD